MLETVLNETVRMREGEKVRLVPKSEALVRTVIQGALQRDPKAVASLMTLMRVTGVGIKETAEQQDDAWTPTEQQVLDYLHRKGAQSKG